MRTRIPPSRFVMLGTQEDGEFWTEYKLSDPDYIKESPKPMIMHPVQIKALIQKSKICPITMMLKRWFYPLTNEIINFESHKIGRFLQAAYN